MPQLKNYCCIIANLTQNEYMNSSKIVLSLLTLFLLCNVNVFAQGRDYNQFSVAISTGLHVPLSPGDGISRSKYIALKQFQLSGRYMFSKRVGIKGHYGFNHFADPNNKDLAVTFNRVGLEGVVNVGRLLNVDFHIREKVGLLFHTGLGVTLANPTGSTGTDHIGNILAGFTGQYKISNEMAIMGDLTYIGNIKQHYGYNGASLNAGEKGTSGGFVNVSVGIIFNLGEQKYHADWY
jgi:OOP family OmpA-OmpF porin